jgi:hypothetical protein
MSVGGEVFGFRLPRPQSGRALLWPGSVVVGGCVASAILYRTNLTAPGIPTICPLRAIFGLDCPGCGGTRMFYCLLHLNFSGAVHYNAVALAAMPLFAWAFVAWIVGRWRGRPVRTFLNWRWTPWIIGIVMAAWTVIRNLPFAPFTSLWV